MAMKNISFMDARRRILKNSNRNAAVTTKDLGNFPPLSTLDASAIIPSFANVVKKTLPDTQLSNISSTRVNELIKMVLSSPNLDLLLKRLFQTIDLHNKNLRGTVAPGNDNLQQH